MKKVEVGYIGFSYKVIENIIFSDNFKLKVIICEKSRASKEIILLSELHNISLYLVEDKEGLGKIVSDNISIVDLYIMYGFGIIIDKKTIKNATIYNIHPGSLETNRGRNPVEWSLLNNDKYTEMTLYKVSELIDLGELIHSEKIEIRISDNNVTLAERLESKIPMLLDKLFCYLKGDIQARVLHQGQYIPRIRECDYTIDLDNDSLTKIFNKIRSQNKYQGAVLQLKNKRYMIKAVKDVEIVENNTVIENEAHMNMDCLTILLKNKYRITFELKK